MVNSALAKALLVVRATVRMRVLLGRQQQSSWEQDEATSDGVTTHLLIDEPSNHRVSRTASRSYTGVKPTGRVSSSALDRNEALDQVLQQGQSGRHGSEDRAWIEQHEQDGTGLPTDHVSCQPQRAWSPAQDLTALGSLVSASYVNLMLGFVPLGMLSGALGWDAQLTFLLNFLSLIPLALILGDVTEDLALQFGDVIGGLLNATFGNIVELILSLAALQKGLYMVVATSLVGSILSNLLLVLGCCFLFGGMYHKVQTFDTTGTQACSSLLLLSSIGITIPSAAGVLISNIQPGAILMISRGTAIILLICYFCYLYFQLYTHSDELAEEEAASGSGSGSGHGVIEEPLLSLPAAFGALGLIGVLVAFHSEFLTGSIQQVSKDTKLSQAFLGMIVLPIAGNACEHMAAVVVAMKNKMTLSMGITVGSSLQIALGVLPVVVLVGWATGHDMSLNLDLFIVVALVLSVIHANMVTAEGRSHWLMGVSLIAVYFLIAIAYFFQD